MTRETTKQLEYIRKVFAPQDALLEEINAALKTAGREIQVGAEEGKTLQLLARMIGAQTIVEVGTLGGYSALWMARALPEDGHLYTCEHDDIQADMAQSFFDKSEQKNRITILRGKGVDVLPTLNDKGPFDMMFIDADKIGYTAYLDWAEQHIRKGGLIVGDNTLLFDAVLEDEPPEGTAPTTWKNMREFNQRLADPAKYCSVMIPTQEGMTVGIKLF